MCHLKNIFDNPTQKPCTKLEATGLEKQLVLLKSALILEWYFTNYENRKYLYKKLYYYFIKCISIWFAKLLQKQSLP